MGLIEGSALVTKSIANEGITTLFGLAGGPIVEVMGYGPQYGVRPIGVRHEQAATFAATAYGYVRNEVGVAVLAAGPGVTNGVTGAHVAFDNCMPLVIIGGSGPQTGRYSGTFQETDNVPMFRRSRRWLYRWTARPVSRSTCPWHSEGPRPDGRDLCISIFHPTYSRRWWMRTR